MESFEIGQMFVGNYPSEAADWCNETQIAHIEEIDWAEDKPAEQRRFQIVANETHEETPEDIQASYTEIVQAALDNFARTRGYDGILSACSYYMSTDSQFEAEADYCVKLRDKTWRTAYEILDKVKAGEMEIPAVEEFLHMLPVADAAWPDGGNA